MKMITESLRWLTVSFEVTFNNKRICLYSSMSFPRIFGALVPRSTVTAVIPQKFICFACNTFHFSVSLHLNYLICISTKGAGQKGLSVSIFFLKHKTKTRYWTEITVANQTESTVRAFVTDRDSFNLQDLQQ